MGGRTRFHLGLWLLRERERNRLVIHARGRHPASPPVRSASSTQRPARKTWRNLVAVEKHPSFRDAYRSLCRLQRLHMLRLPMGCRHPTQLLILRAFLRLRFRLDCKRLHKTIGTLTAYYRLYSTRLAESTAGGLSRTNVSKPRRAISCARNSAPNAGSLIQNAAPVPRNKRLCVRKHPRQRTNRDEGRTVLRLGIDCTTL